MKRFFFLSLLALISFTALAQTPIDILQKQNVKYLEDRESEGYEFRSQIITEFDRANASQNVNIQLSEGYSYLIIALGDDNIPALGLEVSPSKKAAIQELSLDSGLVGQGLEVKPSKSGKFKITILVKDLNLDVPAGFVSFMVLRK
jgi:hypothetical protein